MLGKTSEQFLLKLSHGSHGNAGARFLDMSVANGNGLRKDRSTDIT